MLSVKKYIKTTNSINKKSKKLASRNVEPKFNPTYDEYGSGGDFRGPRSGSGPRVADHSTTTNSRRRGNYGDGDKSVSFTDRAAAASNTRRNREATGSFSRDSRLTTDEFSRITNRPGMGERDRYNRGDDGGDDYGVRTDARMVSLLYFCYLARLPPLPHVVMKLDQRHESY